ncbi:complex I assembly factor ACAD9, mitochondrial [Coccinella septempunctata]|uniref:complex I assembly factor ACAD9, mitochondrial n=1 Tax=Coccinella septempunctata TaxID=41139 RepID=UPI001D061D31|nr:complex I assembly factor ACAD9, mitochondrial [Coccinella septempunctata]
MHFCIRSIPLFVSRRVSTVTLRKCSTMPAEKRVNENSFDKHVNELQSLTTVFAKNRTKLPKREPFVKNLFLGKVDTEILTYPELSKQDIDELETATNILQKIMNQQGEPEDIKEALHRMKMQKCLGLQCSLEIGGREFNQSEHCRFNEILLNNRFKYSLLNNELCINILSQFGTDEQKSKYLGKLLNGEILSSISIANNSDDPNKLRAYINEDLDSYILKGMKRCIHNGANADLFIIFARNGDVVKNSLQEGDFTAYIVDKFTPGITIEEIDVNDPSLEGICNIVFNDVVVTKENIIGLSEMGKDVLTKALPDFHLNMSVLNLNIMKKLASSLSADLLMNAVPGEEIYRTEAITSIMSEILSYVYMVESMVYLTSGLMSTYENQDCDIECLITRIFSTELCLKSTSLGLSLVGTSSINSNHFGQQLHREALTQYISYENENMAKLLVGLLGIQHSGKYLGDTVKKLRNPMFNGTFLLKNLWQNRKQGNDNPSLILELKNYLHPTCQEAADEIEYCVLRLQYATESFVGRYGIDALNCHNHLRRLSESAMHIYAMISCLSRASRSYCIGLENNESEILLANVVCRNSFKYVKANLNDVIQECLIMDDPLKVLSDNLYSKKNYYFAHPLSRNF